MLPTALGIGGLLVGTGLGVATAGTTATEETPEYQALQAELDDAEAAVTDAEEAADQAIADAEASLADREAAVAAAEEEAAALVSDAEAAKAEAEAATAAVLEEVDANRVEPGWYLVGSEIQPGTYRPINDAGYCYIGQYDVASDDIIDNVSADGGRPAFTIQNVPNTQVEISNECGPLQKIG